jgi:arylsulfatase
LIERWWVEAGKHGVLPLDARMQARMGEPKPLAAREKPRYIYYPGSAPQFAYTAVNLKDRSHVITAEVEIPEGGAEGVLLCHGCWFAGYSLYVKENRLHYVHNYLGLAEYKISSDEAVPTGRVDLRFEFQRTGAHCGAGKLFFGDRQVGEGEIPRTVPAVIETSGEGLCCGYDSGLPVTAGYRAPFRFTGKIRRVVVDVDGPPHADPEAAVRAAFTEQ